MLFIIKERIIGDKHIRGIKHLLYYRMSAAFYVNCSLIIHGRLNIMVLLSHVCK